LPEIEIQSHRQLGECWAGTSRAPCSPTNTEKAIQTQSQSTSSHHAQREVDELASWGVMLFTEGHCAPAVDAFPFFRTGTVRGVSSGSITNYPS